MGHADDRYIEMAGYDQRLQCGEDLLISQITGSTEENEGVRTCGRCHTMFAFGPRVAKDQGATRSRAASLGDLTLPSVRQRTPRRRGTRWPSVHEGILDLRTVPC